ncbi:MAG: heme ABC transporter ATP-binding protein [Chloroflexi bacterium]|nr:heme ABC transporter ATP-binding protein [Chloroflexota bacterium]MBT7080976.1 heme ABC transporter ATP-binding protein [Chloroflexota bacterium]MBT7290547.1 heme ABC transporter ATP-binding protein [Chloroflexota bacterium]
MSSIYIDQGSFSYGGSSFAVNNIDLKIQNGEMVGLLGPNGSGKTTLLKLASGELKPTSGQILLDNAKLADLSKNKIARKVAMVPQYFYMPFSFTVQEVVMLGRTPFIKMLAGEKEHDHNAVDDSIEMAGIGDFKDRIFNELSGGERQRAIIALAMAQEPKLLLLDEPTAHLDINHQIELLQLVRRLNREQGITISAVMHDLNLAALYFDRLIMLKDGDIYADGSPTEVLTEETIEAVYSTKVHVAKHPTSNTPHIILLPKAGSEANS